MASVLPPNPTVGQIEDELIFRQICLETLDAESESYEADRQKLEHTIAELERMARAAQQSSSAMGLDGTAEAPPMPPSSHLQIRSPPFLNTTLYSRKRAASSGDLSVNKSRRTTPSPYDSQASSPPSSQDTLAEAEQRSGTALQRAIQRQRQQEADIEQSWRDFELAQSIQSTVTPPQHRHAPTSSTQTILSRNGSFHRPSEAAPAQSQQQLSGFSGYANGLTPSGGQMTSFEAVGTSPRRPVSHYPGYQTPDTAIKREIKLSPISSSIPSRPHFTPQRQEPRQAEQEYSSSSSSSDLEEISREAFASRVNTNHDSLWPKVQHELPRNAGQQLTQYPLVGTSYEYNDGYDSDDRIDEMRDLLGLPSSRENNTIGQDMRFGYNYRQYPSAGPSNYGGYSAYQQDSTLAPGSQRSIFNQSANMLTNAVSNGYQALQNAANTMFKAPTNAYTNSTQYGSGASGGYAGMSYPAPSLYPSSSFGKAVIDLLSDDGYGHDSRWDYLHNDPTKTKEEISNLLENIRPDEDLPPELREGTPEAFRDTLMEHQKLGLAWMKKMEEGSNRGGILADDMGLGKTIQALALMVSRRSEDPRVKTTLIVAPVALMRQWKFEIETKLKPGKPHALSTYIHHGATKRKTYKQLSIYDVVLTTFGTLASEFKRKEAWERRRAGSPDAIPGAREQLSLIGEDCKWYRVIIDEAQCIKNKDTKTSQAACMLQSQSRFCMTGTPMMNSVVELYSLIRFLRIRPYCDWRRFNTEIARPLKSYGKDAAMKKLQALIQAILLRRTKKSKIDGKPIISLPQRIVEVQHVAFSEDEQAFYAALETRAQLQFNRYLRAGTAGRNYSNALVLLLRLRQACCHPHLIRDFGVAANSDVPLDKMLDLAKELSDTVVTRIKETGGSFECPVCYDAVENPAIFIPCGHDTCSECFSKLTDPSRAIAEGNEDGNVKCPECRGRIDPQRITDYNSFRKVHLGEGEGLVNGSGDDLLTESDTESDTSDDSDDDTTESLDGFIVNDDNEEERDEAGDEDNDGSDDSPSRPDKKEDKKNIAKSKSKSKPKSKGKGKAKKAKKPRKTIAELKREGMRNAAARRRYKRRLERDWETSAKIEKTMEILHQIHETDPREKTIIFSQFTSLLDLLEIPIDREGWGYRRYDGSMSATMRTEAVERFMRDPLERIMLVSLKAGNAGLNLTAASQVIILDPFWNPYVEEQAIDRAHRIGQRREVRVHRVLVPDTVEDRILALQEKKRELISTALDENAGKSISRLGVRELAYLFGITRDPNDNVVVSR